MSRCCKLANEEIEGGRVKSSSKELSSEQEKADQQLQDRVDEADDPELEELLDLSLGEFGKHLPKETTPPPKPKPVTVPLVPPGDGASMVPPVDDPLSSPNDINELLSEEIAVETETHLNEAVEMFCSENPELWQQFENFAKSIGLEEGSGPVLQPTSGAASKGESSVDESTKNSMEEQLEETLHRLKQTTEQIESGGNLEGLLGQVDMSSDDSEDQLMKMMQGMMNTLLSKEVLYPSLTDLCKQYPEWLANHKDKLSESEVKRYCKQQEIMTAICQEFEGQPDSGDPSQESSERILQLMQELQQFGQPPADLAGESHAGFPPAGLPELPPNPENCSIM